MNGDEARRRHDVIVIGGGPAGLTAGLFGARSGLNVLVLSSESLGGTLLNVSAVEDFPGLPVGLPGYDLGPLMHQQAAEAGAQFAFAQVDAVSQYEDEWLVAYGDARARAGAVIVASGTSARELMVPGAQRLAGRGVSRCASCDGPLFRGRVIGVVGGGDSGLSEALHLALHAERVVLFERQAELPGLRTFRDRVQATENIEVRCKTLVVGVLGTERVEAAQLRDLEANAVVEIPLDALFVNVGRDPQTSFLDPSIGVVDANGRIQTESTMQTQLRGLFAAGDVRSGASGQAVAACGDGAVAALSVHDYLASPTAGLLMDGRRPS